MDSWQLSPIFERYTGSGSLTLVVLLGLALLVGWAASVFFTQIKPTWRRAILAALRFCTIVLLILAMLRPERVFTELQKQSATLAVLLDRSRSMSIEDSLNGKPRWQVLRESFAASAAALDELSNDLEIKVYAFDAEAEPVEIRGGKLTLAAEAIGDESAYGQAMREVLRREDGKRLIAFILVGDGAQQTIAPSTDMPETTARQLDQLNCPLYSVPLGRQGTRQARDVVVESMPDDLVVFVKNRLDVTGTLRVSGYVNRDIPVQLVVEKEPGKEEIVATENYRALRDGDQLRYQLSYTPEQAGEYKIAVRAVAQEGEVTTTNNELPTYLTVLAGGLRVLYLQGELRREQRFLRRALAASPDIDVTLLTLHTRDRRRWPVPNLAEYFTPGAYDVYILGDLDSEAFHPGDAASGRTADLAMLRQAVQRGAGLLMLGGWHSFRPGGYQGTPLAEVMPVERDAEIDRFVRQKFGERIDTKLHLKGPLEMRPAEPWGARHYLMRLGSGDNRVAWSQLPPLAGANKFRGAKDGTQVLAEDQLGRPLLISGEPGGRVLAFAGDSTWRWVMRGHGDAHRRFWRQAILWLARKDEITKGNVWVQMDSRRYMAGQRVTFAAGARTAEGDPLPDAKLSAQIVAPDGTRRGIRLVRQGDQFRGAIPDCSVTGTYSVEVVARQDADEIGTDTARFMVYTKDRELSGATADPSMLAGLAAQTSRHGGRQVSPEELPALFAELAVKPMQLQEKVRTTVTYWDQWYIFVLLASLLSLEWFLRKRWRLV